MSDPYLTPKTKEEVIVSLKNRQRNAPLIGCVSGGCLVPILGVVFCSFVFNDIGGILFWPFVSFLLGSIGMIIGIVYRASKR